MTAVAINLSSDTFLEVKQTAKQNVAVAQKRVNIAVTMLGHCLDFFGGKMVSRLNQKLADSLVRMKGLVAIVPDLDPSRIIDPRMEVARGLNELQRCVNELHRTSLKARDDVKLRRTHEAFREAVEICAALHEAVMELKAAIADHDSKATMGDHARRLMADLRRTDDVPAGRYADLVSALRGAPTRDRQALR